MSRTDEDRLDDIANAIAAIHAHLVHGPISVEIVMDAVAMRLLEIGEAVKGLSPDLTATEPDVDWTGAAGMRDFLAHHYFATRPDLVQRTLDERLPGLDAAITRLQRALSRDPDSASGGPTEAPPRPQREWDRCLRRSARVGRSLLRHLTGVADPERAPDLLMRSVRGPFGWAPEAPPPP